MIAPGKVVIVYGPQGCGKSANAETIGDFFGVARVVDPWDNCGVKESKGGVLYLTNKRPMYAYFQMYQVFEFHQIMEVIRNRQEIMDEWHRKQKIESEKFRRSLCEQSKKGT